jgi:acetyl-CoA C-acetyltransferase
MTEPVYVVGVGRTDFRRNLRKEGRALGDLIVEAGRAAIVDARIAPSDVGAGVVGNFAAGLFTRQLHLGAFLPEIDDALRGLPTMHVEAACASGGVAVLSAAQQIIGGLHDVMLVVGAEQQKTMPPAEGADVLAAAAHYSTEKAQYGDFMFPKLFARIAQIYAERYGLTEAQLAKVALKNHAHARLNPLAQMRESTLTCEGASTASEANPMVAPPLKVSDCSPITDGAAALVLCSQRFLDKLGPRRVTRLVGYGHTTDHLSLERKEIPHFPIAAQAANRAYTMAGIGPQDIHGAEVHDCFSISEIVQYELLGFAAPGKGVELLESGATALPAGRCPVNPGGGLIGDGHPVGATGVRQVVEAHQQLTGNAGARQIEGAKRFLTCNIGGSVTTTVALIWEAK